MFKTIMFFPKVGRPTNSCGREHTGPHDLRTKQTKDEDRQGCATSRDTHRYPYLAASNPTDECVWGTMHACLWFHCNIYHQCVIDY